MTLVGRYRIDQLVGKGGMGRVYLATQLPLNRPVAVKILSPEFQKKDPQFPRRFFLEAATAAQLNHPNTITVFDYGETEEGELFIAMEYLPGRPLSRAIASDGPFSADRALHIAMQIVRALREAHQKGIVHRDLKPGNIMLMTEGDDLDYAKVLDFGLVKLIDTDASQHHKLYDQLPNSSEEEVGELTRAGMFLGSPKYMSPEQIESRPIDPRTDIYSLGVIMFQMLAGRVPFRGNTGVEIIFKHVNQPVPAIHEINPEADAPPELERLIVRCLEKRPEGRPASMADLLGELKEVRKLIMGVGSVSGLSLDSIGQYSASSLPPAPVTSSPPPPPREAAFVDSVIPDDSPSVPNERRSIPVSVIARPAGRTWPMLGAVVALAAGAGAYFVSRQVAGPTPPIVEPAPDPTPPPPAPRATRLSLESRPDGAEVFENEVSLGVTPLEHEVVVRPGEPVERRFVFKKEGFEDETVNERAEGERVRIVATLRAVEAPKHPPPKKAPVKKPPQKLPPDYKENPY